MSSFKEKMKTSFGMNVAMVFVVFVLLYIMFFASLHCVTRHGEELAMPDVRGVKIDSAINKLKTLGFDVLVDPSVKARHQRFAGDDDARIDTLHRVAEAAPSIAMACRGGYGTTRLLDRIDWTRIARSVEHGTRWVGYSDLTGLQIALSPRHVPPTLPLRRPRLRATAPSSARSPTPCRTRSTTSYAAEQRQTRTGPHGVPALWNPCAAKVCEC